ncbi:MAG: anti-sigma F factor, partial [Clostridia bacterium]|nr:anti-sigma F factor [Clostridia bacterium]
ILEIIIQDYGLGIENIEQALQFNFTTRTDQERAGMGFSIMQGFSDHIRVRSLPGKGTTVVMDKYIGGRHERNDL